MATRPRRLTRDLFVRDAHTGLHKKEPGFVLCVGLENCVCREWEMMIAGHMALLVQHGPVDGSLEPFNTPCEGFN